jgi:hypothetical protein
LSRNVRQVCDGRGPRFGISRDTVRSDVNAKLQELARHGFRGAPPSGFAAAIPPVSRTKNLAPFASQTARILRSNAHVSAAAYLRRGLSGVR